MKRPTTRSSCCGIRTEPLRLGRKKLRRGCTKQKDNAQLLQEARDEAEKKSQQTEEELAKAKADLATSLQNEDEYKQAIAGMLNMGLAYE